MQSSTARHILMSEEETQAVMDTAQFCIESECSLSETTELLQTLKATEKDLEERLDQIMNMISHLQHINEKEERQTDEVRAFVRDMLRVFSTEVSTVRSCLFEYDTRHDAHIVLPCFSAETQCTSCRIFWRCYQALGCLQLLATKAMEANCLSIGIITTRLLLLRIQSSSSHCRHSLSFSAHNTHAHKKALEPSKAVRARQDAYVGLVDAFATVTYDKTYLPRQFPIRRYRVETVTKHRSMNFATTK